MEPERQEYKGHTIELRAPEGREEVRARGVRLGLLAQHVHFEPGSTVHESALAAFGHLQQIEHEMHELEHRMAEAGAEDLDAVLERYSELQHEFEREGGFEYAARAEAILQGLGFERDVVVEVVCEAPADAGPRLRPFGVRRVHFERGEVGAD